MPDGFETRDGNKIHLGRWSIILPVNKFFGHYLETITISRKDGLKTILQPRPSGSIAVHMRSIMEDISTNQLRLIERDVLLDKAAATGPDVYN